MASQVELDEVKDSSAAVIAQGTRRHRAACTLCVEHPATNGHGSDLIMILEAAARRVWPSVKAALLASMSINAARLCAGENKGRRECAEKVG